MYLWNVFSVCLLICPLLDVWLCVLVFVCSVHFVCIGRTDLRWSFNLDWMFSPILVNPQAYSDQKRYALPLFLSQPLCLSPSSALCVHECPSGSLDVTVSQVFSVCLFYYYHQYYYFDVSSLLYFLVSMFRCALANGVLHYLFTGLT